MNNLTEMKLLWINPNRVESIPDAVAKALEIHVSGKNDSVKNVHIISEETVSQIDTSVNYNESSIWNFLRIGNPKIRRPQYQSNDLCTACGSASLISAEGCKTCVNCGHSKCS